MFVLLLIGMPVLEVFAFIEVGLAIGWLWAVVLLVGTSVLGVQLLRIQGRAAIMCSVEIANWMRPAVNASDENRADVVSNPTINVNAAVAPANASAADPIFQPTSRFRNWDRSKTKKTSAQVMMRPPREALTTTAVSSTAETPRKR